MNGNAPVERKALKSLRGGRSAVAISLSRRGGYTGRGTGSIGSSFEGTGFKAKSMGTDGS